MGSHKKIGSMGIYAYGEVKKWSSRDSHASAPRDPTDLFASGLNRILHE